MKILLINKYHYLKGGAERAYFDTAQILMDHGHQVAFFSMHHPDNFMTDWSKYFIDQVDYEAGKMSFSKKIIAALKMFYNLQAKKNLKKLLKEFQPDVAHLHNIYHQISPSILNVLKEYNIPVVLTLHDYKLISPNYHLLVRGEIWEKTKDGRYYICFKDRCFKDSYMSSLIMTLEAYVRKWFKSYNKVDLFISPSRFLIKKFNEFGFDKEIAYLPNPLQLNIDAEILTRKMSEKYIIYYGRLSEEKGISDLIEAYGKLKTNVKLLIVGSGDELKQLKQKVKNDHHENNIVFYGHTSGPDLFSLVYFSEFIVVPSKWYENAPYSIIEAMSLGKTVIASDIGGLSEMIKHKETGFLFEPGNTNELAQTMENLLNNKNSYMIGQNAKDLVLEKHDPDKYYNQLIGHYNRLILENKV